MFQSDNVPFSVFPVSGSEELRKRGKEIPDDEQNRAIVLINCGGTEDVREMMDLKVNCRAYVLDSHRPLSLQNVSEENKDVYVIRDDSKEGDDYFPEMDTDSEEDDDDEKNEDEAESDFSSDDDDDEEETARRKQIKLDRQRERQSQREAQQPESPRTVALRRKKRQAERVEYWRRGSYYGRSAGLCAFDMAFDMKKEGLEKNLLLWLAIVSLTDQLAHQKVSQETYKQYCFELMSQVSNQINENMHQERALDDGTMVKVFEDRKISIEVEELRFEMMRHWNLYDAMLHSPYVVTRLQAWKESGVHLLDSLLATCGLSLQ
jgi:cell division control protein 45